MAVSYKVAEELSICKERITNTLVKIDIRGLTLKELKEKYRSVEVAIDDIYNNPKTLRLFIYVSEFTDYSLTIDEWFATLGDRSLLLSDGYPELNTEYIRYNPCVLVGSEFKLAQANKHPSHEAAVELLTDVIYNHNELDIRDISEKGLWSYGGYFHRNSSHDYGVRLFGAGQTARISGSLSSGFLYFGDTVKKIPITKDDIFKVNEELTYYDSLLIKTKETLFNKTVGIVIGGYLHLLDGLVKVVGDNLIKLSLRNIQLVKRVECSKDHLDLSFMGLDNFDQPTLVKTILDDENLLKYLTCQYSFLVIIDNPDISLEKTSVEYASRLGYYYADASTNLGLLVDSLGRGLEYYNSIEDGKHCLSTENTHSKRLAITNTNWFDMIRVNDSHDSFNPTSKVIPTMLNYIKRNK